MKNKDIILLLIIVLSIAFLFSACDFNSGESGEQQSSNEPTNDNSSLDENSVDERPTFQWPFENAFVENIAPFTGGKIVDITQKSNSVLITIANVEESAFKLYINTLKHLNFTDLIFENNNVYSATKADSPIGKKEGITVSYNNETSEMTIDSSIEIEE